MLFLKGGVDTFTSDDGSSYGYFVFVKMKKVKLLKIFSSINVNVRQWKSDALKNGGENYYCQNPNG